MSTTKQTQADRERNLRMRTANNLLVTLLGWGDDETYWTPESQREWLAQERQMNAAREVQLERSIKTAAQPDRSWDLEEAARTYQVWLVEHPDVPPTWRALRSLGEFYRAAKRSGTVLLPDGWVAEWDEGEAAEGQQP